VGRSPSNFRQLDVARAIKAAKGAGLDIVRIEVDPKTAKIVVVVKESETVKAIKENPWDKESPFILKTKKRRKSCKSDADTNG
jgi:hypothetical protein